MYDAHMYLFSGRGRMRGAASQWLGALSRAGAGTAARRANRPPCSAAFG